MEWEYTITDENGEDPTPLLIKYLEEHPLMKPYSVYVDNDHAEFIEFGSAPASDTTKKYYKGESPVKKKILDWTAFKFGLSDEAEIREIGTRIYRKIMENGIDPYPYMRPAMYSVLSDIEAEDPPWLDSPHPSGCMYDICDEIANLMADILAMNDNIYSSELITSISVVEPSEIPSATAGSANATQNNNIDDEVWDSKTVGYDGRKQPNYRNYRGV